MFDRVLIMPLSFLVKNATVPGVVFSKTVVKYLQLFTYSFIHISSLLYFTD